MSYDYPNAISQEAYVTLMTSGVPTTSGNISFNELTYHTYSGPNMYGNKAMVDTLGSPYDITGNTVLFMFAEPIEDYTNRNMGEGVTVDIGGVGIVIDNGLHLCPVSPDGTFLTQYMGAVIGAVPPYTENNPLTARMCLAMAYNEPTGGHLPCVAIGALIDITAYPTQYADEHYSYNLGYFNLVGNDILEYALHGDYWNSEQTAPDNNPDGGGATPPQDNQLEMPDLPTTGALATKLISAYNVTLAQLQSLGQYLWSANFVDNVLKNFQSPFENIVSCHILPFSPNLIPSYAHNIIIGNMDSNISSHRVTDVGQYVQLDFGKIYLSSMFNTFGDFDTRVTLYLPFSGYTELDVSDLMGNNTGDGYISVKYRVDILTGDFIATVEASTPFSTHFGVQTHIIEQKTGNMASQIPLSGTNYMSVYNTLFSSVGQFASQNILGGVGTLMQTKPQYGKTGNLGGNTGRLGYNKPYLLVHYPNYREPKLWRDRNGVISNIAYTLSELTGYIKVKQGTFKGANIPCTDTELKMITDMLEQGVVTNEN